MSVLRTKPNDVFKFVKFMRKEGRDIEGGGCMKDKDGRLVISEKDRGKLWKKHMEKIMNVENEWDQMVKAHMVKRPVEGVTDEKVMEAMNKMKLGKAAGPSEVNMDMIIASGRFGVGVIKKLCQRVFDEKGMPEKWKTSVVVPIFKGKGYDGLWGIQRSKVTGACNEDSGESAGEQNLKHRLFLRECKRSFVKEKKRLYMCLVDLEKAFDRVPRKVMEWALRKKGLAEVLVQAVMSLYEGSRTKVRVGSGTSEEWDIGSSKKIFCFGLNDAIFCKVSSQRRKHSPC